MDTTQKMTVAEALEAGYTKFGFADREWQSALDIESEANEYFDNPLGSLLLFEKTEYHPSIDARGISDILADHIADNHGDETGDDTDDVYDTVKAIDFTSTANMINEQLSKHTYYMLTDIELIP